MTWGSSINCSDSSECQLFDLFQTRASRKLTFTPSNLFLCYVIFSSNRRRRKKKLFWHNEIEVTILLCFFLFSTCLSVYLSVSLHLPCFSSCAFPKDSRVQVQERWRKALPWSPIYTFHHKIDAIFWLIRFQRRGGVLLSTQIS